MKRIDRFILTAFVGPFFMILLVVIFILVMQLVWVYIDELVGKGLSMRVIGEFLMWGCCTVMPLALPLATLLASMMAIGTMGENNELIALKAAGVSVFRVMLPILVTSVGISIGALFIINHLVPTAWNEIYTLMSDIRRTKQEINIPAGTFYDGVDGYVLRVDEQDEDGMMTGVMLYDHTSKGNTRLTLADSATMKMSKDKSSLTMTMYDGINYQETNEKKLRDTSLALQKIDFSKQTIVISLENYSFNKSDSAMYGDQPKALPIKKLKSDTRKYEQQRDSVKASQFQATAASRVFRKYSQLDTARSGIRRNFEDTDFLKFATDEDLRDALRKATESARTLENNVQSYQFGAFDYTVRLRWTNVEYLHRYGQALACFVMFFIGAPLGALIRKGGVGVSAIVSVLFFVLYWIIDITAVKLAQRGALNITVGSFLSAGVLFPIGLRLTWLAIHDTDFSNLDTIKNWWRKAKSKAGDLFRKTRIIYMGTPEFAVAPLKTLIDNKYKVVAVVTVPDKPSGRGQKVNESAVKKFAVEQGIPVLQPVKLKDPEFLAQLKSYKADLFVVVAFRMLPEEVWAMPKLGTFNLHASLLPQYRGAAPINWAVINGENRTGATTFMIDKNIDTGGIILRQGTLISEDDTAGDVHDRLMEIGSELVLQTTEGLIEHNVDTRVQRSFIQGSEVLKPAPKLTRELCHIDWTDTVRQTVNLIRGLSPYPAAFTELSKEGGNPVQLKIFKAKAAGSSSPAAGLAPGTVRSDGKTYLHIAAADGAVALEDVQIAGKKRMDIHSFLAGFRDPETYGTTAGTSKAEILKTRS